MTGPAEDERGLRGALPWVLVALVVVGAALLWWSARNAPLATPPEQAAPEPDVAAAPTPGPPGPAEAPAPLPEDLPEPIRRYLDATPYPKTSGRLTRLDTDLLAPNSRHESFRGIPDTVGADAAAVVSSRLTADRYYYESDQTVHATLDVKRGEQPLAVRIQRSDVVREGRGGGEGEADPVSFVSDGAQWRLDLPLARFAEHHGPLLLTVAFEYAPGATHEETLRFFVTPEERIPAVFTGSFRERLEAGSLRVEAGIEVLEAGFYRVDANLFSESGSPVGYVTFKGELERGEQTLPLELYGKVLRDAHSTGPFVMRNLRGYRFREGEYPDRERMRDFDGEYRTREYVIADFTDEAHLSEHERRMVDLMLEDVARGISLDVPDLPGPAGS